MDIVTMREKALALKRQTGLASSPVGVKFCFEEPPGAAKKARLLAGHRYCQALMKARHGEHVLLDGKGIACPAAAAAFGFRPLPDGLKNGSGLVGFGITAAPATGIKMFEAMPALQPGRLKVLYLFPLETAETEPDVVVVEDEIEKLMWLVLAELNRRGGSRVQSGTAVLQAACVDATVIPYAERRFNMSFGCYGCRDATDIGHNETLLGFPFVDFEAIAGFVNLLAQKAIQNSRGKNAYALLKKSAAVETAKADPFRSNGCSDLS